MNAMTAPLTAASRQWASRPDDQRFVDLDAMLAEMTAARQNSKAVVVSSHKLEVHPIEGDRKGLAISGPNGNPVLPTNWSFGQLAERAKAPAGYMRSLPTSLAADCLNYGLRRNDAQEIGVLLRKDDKTAPATMTAATGPNYGRVWNQDIVKGLIDRFGNGRDGDFRVPGEFGKAVDVTKANTTLYASDRNMFVFLADEEHRIEMRDRRNGKPGSLARGFFVWNSEVGAETFGVATFLFDYVCSNRMVWGAEGYREVRLRHTAAAPDRYIEEVAPALMRYAQSSTQSITDALAAARQKRVDDVDAFLGARRFTKSLSKAISLAHLEEEGRPIETLWDLTVGMTAVAREIKHQDARVELERKAGDIFALAS